MPTRPPNARAKAWAAPSSTAAKRLRGRRLQELRRAVFLEQGYECAAPECRRLTTDLELDHIKPLYKGGTDDRDNLQGLCPDCHAAKTARDMGQRPRPPNRGVDADGWPR